MKHLLLILSIFLLTLPSVVNSSQSRVALVIGNGAYKEGPLRNPVNDARILKNVLMRAGFQVSLLENGNKRQMLKAVKDFGKKLRKSDVARKETIDAIRIAPSTKHPATGRLTSQIANSASSVSG